MRANIFCTIDIGYRHPSNTEIPNFLNHLEICISNLTTNNSLFNIMGNLNIIISANNRSKNETNYVNLLLSYGFFPLFTLPTSITPTSATITYNLATSSSSHFFNKTNFEKISVTLLFLFIRLLL